MKSIKEKAEELYPTRKVSAVLDLANEKFVEGANYVLGEVEMLLNSQRFVDNPSQELYELIKQLKK